MNSTESVSFDWVHLLNIITWSHWHTLLQVLLWAPCIAQAKWNQNRLSKRIGQIPALTMQWTTEHWPTWWLFVGRFYHTVSHSASPRSDVRWKQNSLNRNQTSNYRGWGSLESIKTNLHNHDVSAAVTRTDSSGFNSEFSPINDGITIDGNDWKYPRMKMIKFFADEAKNCRYKKIRLMILISYDFMCS